MLVSPYSWGFVSPDAMLKHGLAEGVEIDLSIERLEELVDAFSVMLKKDAKSKRIIMFIDVKGKTFGQR